MAIDLTQEIIDAVAELNPDIDLSNWEQRVVPDFVSVASKINEAKGPDRTMAQFAKACGTSPSTLSRIKSMKMARPMSVELMISVVRNQDPNSAVNIDDLLFANGWRPKLDVTAETLNNSNFDTGELVEYIKAQLKHDEIVDQRIRSVRNLLSTELLSRGANVSVHSAKIDPNEATDDLVLSFGLEPVWDLLYRVDIFRGYEFWVVGIVPLKTSEGDTPTQIDRKVWTALKYFSPLFLTDQWEPEKLDGKKVTLLFIDEKLFEIVYDKLKQAPLNNSFSLMLVDLDKSTIVKESQLMSRKGLRFRNLLSVRRQDEDKGQGNWLKLGSRPFSDINPD